jgi:hypothetical protein
MNAKQELLAHIEKIERRKNNSVKFVSIVFEKSWGNEILIKGTLEEVLPKLDFDYNDGYGSQELDGTIWFSDGTWSEREEYDGSEYWEYKLGCPDLPI